MSNLFRNPEDRFSLNEAHINSSASICLTIDLSIHSCNPCICSYASICISSIHQSVHFYLSLFEYILCVSICLSICSSICPCVFTEDRPYSPGQEELFGLAESLKTSHKHSEQLGIPRLAYLLTRLLMVWAADVNLLCSVKSRAQLAATIMCCGF